MANWKGFIGRNLLAIVWYFALASFGVLLWEVGGGWVQVRKMGQDALDHTQKNTEYLQWVREELSEPNAVDADSRKLIETLLPQCEQDNAELIRLANLLASVSPFRVGLRGSSVSRDITAYNQVFDRLEERLKVLDPTLKEALARSREKPCYCSCANPGSPPALRGRKTARQCGTLCEQEGFASATCM